MAHAAPCYEIVNPQDRQCPLTARLNNLYGTVEPKPGPIERFERTVQVPQGMGNGYWQHTRLRPSVDLVLSEACFQRPITLSSIEREESVNLGFCLGERIHWRMEGKKEEMALDTGEVMAYVNTEAPNSCQYDSGRLFKGFTLKLDPARLKEEWQLPLDDWLAALTRNPESFANRQATPALQRLVREIVQCPYQGDIKRMYLTGKALELTSVYLHEMVLEREAGTAQPGLTRSDIASLHRAKELLDGNLSSPPGLRALTKLVALNEFKLKKGFKQLFGMSVHAYVIDRRVETAYALLQEGKRTVTAAAHEAGFARAGHFSEYFKRKYGITPSEYQKSLPAKHQI
ncbi:helix-turn-helix transcriptional regulator [Cohnella cellulosilytica]|uniref:Helix-turn-helix transcriptional regulator n=1 Tax=Cohnella cellulosilytica TaxID=986710 RepID=A0ABW2FJ29_9BACL